MATPEWTTVRSIEKDGAPPPVRTIRLGPSAAGRCRRRVHLDADPTADRSRRKPLDDGTRLRWEENDRHLARVLTAVAGSDRPTGWDPAGPERPSLVVAPELTSAHRTGRPDLLLWDTDGYVPVLVRGHRTTDPGEGAELADLTDPLTMTVSDTRKPRPHSGDQLALAHLYRLLQELGLADSRPRGGVIGRGLHDVSGGPGDDADLVLWWGLEPMLADYDARFADRLAVVTAALTGAPALARPSRVSECRRCSWWPVCSAELTASHDISLVAAGGDGELMRAAGITTLDELAAAPAELVAALPLTGIPADSARLRARAMLAGVPLVRRSERVEVPRADLELDVDMESYGEDGAYLWGTYLSGPAVAGLGLIPGYQPFATWRRLPDPDEGRAFAEFWAYLSRLRGLAAEHGLTFAAYCYSRQAEERWIKSTPRRYPDIPRMPSPAEVDEFCVCPQWVDMYQQIKQNFIVPGSMKLKVLAPLTGFAWRDVDPGGENSMAWYRLATDAEPDLAMAMRILEYNEDDVRATLALRRWITARSGHVPTVAELNRD